MVRCGFGLLSVLLLGSGALAQAPGYRMPLLILLVRPDIQAELKLSGEQTAKIKEKLGDMIKDGPNGGKYLQPEEGTDLNTLEADVLKVLDEKQQKRFRECCLQIAGFRAVLDDSVAKELGFTDEQKKQAAALVDENREKMQELLQGGGSPPSAETMEKVRAVQGEFRTKVEKLLTAEQQQKLTALKGAKFEMKMGNPKK